MAQEFKNYDKVYKSYENCTLTYEQNHKDFNWCEANLETKWEYPLGSYTAEEIALAVYGMHELTIGDMLGAQAWQKFRVSLKGNTTSQKLYRLKFRLNRAKRMYATNQPLLRQEQIRIDNYIGALKRGGLLTLELRVIK